jgi:hypothetical protein
MTWKVLKTEPEYQKAIKRTLAIFHAEEGTLLSYRILFRL